MFRELLLTYRYSNLGTIAPAAGLLLVPIALILLARRWVTGRLARGATRCPRCGSATVRVSRRTRDRALSLLVPVRRFRCAGEACGWTGLSARPGAPGGTLTLAGAAITLILFVVIDALMITAGFLLGWLRSIL